MRQTVRKRLRELEKRLVPSESYVWVRMPDGHEAEVLAGEWYEHRNEWLWLRMGRGFDPSFRDIFLLLAWFDQASKNG